MFHLSILKILNAYHVQVCAKLLRKYFPILCMKKKQKNKRLLQKKSSFTFQTLDGSVLLTCTHFDGRCLTVQLHQFSLVNI